MSDNLPPRRPRRLGRIAMILPLMLMVIVTTVAPRPARAEVSAAQVENAIRRGVAYLQSRQGERGNWDEYSFQSCGLSALCTLALLTAGVPADDPSIVRALRYLRGFEPNETYSVSLQTLVYCQVGAAADLPRIRRNVRWLEQGQIKADAGIAQSGAWTYTERLGGGDPSNTQFALLALQAAEERGIAVSGEVFARSQRYWENLQQARAGGWPYSPTIPSSGSMTCAGIASIVICRGHAGAGEARVADQTIRCCGAVPDEDDPVEQGLQWLAERFSVTSHPGTQGTSRLFYYLYALERVGRMTGRRLIGGHDWYRAGSEHLVGVQDPFQGFWVGRGMGEENRNVATSFALLFLAKGKRQVVLGRLEHGPGRQWNTHPEGPRQLTRHLERDWGRDLTWQSVQLNGSSVADLLQTPVLLISGNQPLQFDPQEQQLLREYVEQGGFLFFEATAGDGCGPAGPFERSVQELCETLFEAPLEKLPPDHPVWNAERRVNPAALGEDFWLYGVQACCRTSVVYAPLSLTCRWELSDPTGRRALPAGPVRQQVDAAVHLGQNVVAYATGRELREKLDAPMVVHGESVLEEPQRGVMVLPNLQLAAGGEDARRALPNLVELVRRQVPVRLAPAAEDVPAEAELLEPYPILWMHGRTDFTLGDDQIDQLRTYIDHGGTLIASSICGSEAFDTAVRRELARVLPESPLRPVPREHPLFTENFGGYDLSGVTIRTPTRGRGEGQAIQRRQGTPVLETAERNDRIAVFYSPLDLSCALESPNSIQCPGYDTRDAARISTNLILYALQQ